MDATLGLTVLLSVVLNCNGVSIREQLAHIARRFGAHDDSVIIGAPSFPSHLPEAEPILPGHTLIRPVIGMLKSAVKFPHRDLENGAGVYGNIKNLGLRYDNRNERVLYSGFRRTTDDDDRVETVSDTSSDEESSLRLAKKNKRPQRNFIKKYIKIFPSETTGKKKIPPKQLHRKIQNLIHRVNRLRGITKNRKKSSINQHNNEVDTRGRSKRNIMRSLNTKLFTSAQTHLFAKLLLQKLQANKQRRKQQSTSIIIIQPGDLNQSYESNSLEEMKPKSYEVKSTLGLTNDLLKKLASRQRRQQNIVILKPEDTEPIYAGGVESIEEIPPLVTERPRNWFYKDMQAYNHIKISPDAPDQEEYMPKDYSEEKSDDRNWWYYHQADFIPFEENDKQFNNLEPLSAELPALINNVTGFNE